jgi:preprotein translocase subunit YajC
MTLADQTELKTSTGTPSGQPGMPERPPSGGMGELLVMLVPMILIFYFVFIRPENKRRKEKEALLGSVKPKDKVVTIGGLFGTVVEIDGDEIVLQVDPKRDVKLRFRRSAVDVVVRAEEKTEEKK